MIREQGIPTNFVVQRDGVAIAARSWPGDRPVLLHHALTMSSRSFEANGLHQRLSDAGFRCVVLDAPGHGRTSTPASPEHYTLDAHVANAIAVMDALDIDRFAFVGYSMGAWVGTGMLAQAAHRLTDVALAGWDPLSGAALFTAQSTPAARSREFVQVIERLSRGAGLPAPSDDRVAAMLMTYENLFRDLPDLTAPDACPAISIQCGRDDPYHAHAEEAARRIGAPFTSLPGDHVGAFSSGAYVAAVLDALPR